MGGPQPALRGVRGPQAIQSWLGHTCGRHMSTPPGKHRGEEVREGEGRKKGEDLEGKSKEEERSRGDDQERGRDEEELRRRKEEGDSATLHQYAQGLYFVQK